MIKFSMFDLLLAMSCLALVVQWQQTPMPEQPKFNTWILFYHTPTVPEKFFIGERRLPQLYSLDFLSNDYRSGSDLFLRSHKQAWQSVGVLFVEERIFWRDSFTTLPDLEKLSDGEWTTQHELYARAMGQKSAIDQIDRLIAKNGKSKTLEMLRRIPWYARYLELRWLGSCTLIFTIIVWMRILNVKRRKSRQQASVFSQTDNSKTKTSNS